MVHTTRLAMNTALKNVVVPHLREHGFKGSLQKEAADAYFFTFGS